MTTYLLFTDETNLQPDAKAKFFIYGGVFFPAEQLASIHLEVESIRTRYGFRPGDELKFDTRSRPTHVDIDSHREAKKDIIAASQKHGVSFTAQLVHHNVARTQKQADLVSWGADCVFEAFQRFLEEVDAYGLVAVDRLPMKSDYRYLVEKFQQGLNYGKAHKHLDRICAFTSTCVGASHVSSVIDVVLGSFRFCVNERDNTKAPREMFPEVVRLMWNKEVDGKMKVLGRGLILRPIEVKAPLIKKEYDQLLDHLSALYLAGGT